MEPSFTYESARVPVIAAATIRNLVYGLPASHETYMYRLLFID